MLPGRLQTNRVLPLGIDRCRVDFDYFYAPDVPAAARLDDQRFSDEVQREDVAICEAVQRGLASGSYVAGRLNARQESGLWRFHELLRAAYRNRAAPSAKASSAAGAFAADGRGPLHGDAQPQAAHDRFDTH